VLADVVSGRWIRNRERSRAFAVIYGGLGLAWTTLFVALLVSAIQSSEVLFGVFVVAVFGTLAACTWRVAVGCAKAGLMVTDEFVVIKNPWRTREVPIADVLRFSAGRQPALMGNPTPGVLLERKDGRNHAIWALAREGWVWNSSRNVKAWSETVAVLNKIANVPGD
jgi:hypothetical protein